MSKNLTFVFDDSLFLLEGVNCLNLDHPKSLFLLNKTPQISFHDGLKISLVV
jgi:hypothetical protein